MSRTHHLTHAEFVGDVVRPTRRRARSRLTKVGYYFPCADRPNNAGAWPGGVGFNAGQRRRKEGRDAKRLGRRRDRRRREREML